MSTATVIAIAVGAFLLGILSTLGAIALGISAAQRLLDDTSGD